MESIKDNPDFCNTVLYKNIYTVLYHKNRDDIENFTFINLLKIFSNFKLLEPWVS